MRSLKVAGAALALVVGSATAMWTVVGPGLQSAPASSGANAKGYANLPIASPRLDASNASAPVVSQATAGYGLGPYGRYDHLRQFPGARMPPHYDAIKVGDLTGDGRDDVVAIPTDNELHVFVQQANGTLALPSLHRYSTQSSPHEKDLALGDMNGDAVLDVVASHYTDSAEYGGLAMLLSDGRGGLNLRIIPPMDSVGVRELATLDVDHDGHTDVLGASDSEACPREIGGGWCPGLRIYYGDGRGGILRRESVVLRFPGMDMRNLSVADMNGDGSPDVGFVVTSYYDSQFMVAHSNGIDGLLPAVALHDADHPWPTAVGDLNRDARIDTYSYVSGVRIQRADLSFGDPYPVAVPGSDYAAVAAVDLDKDGATDVVTSTSSSVTAPDIHIGLSLQRAGKIASPLIHDVSGYEPHFYLTSVMAHGDINGDGCTDLAFTAAFGGLIFLPGMNCRPRAVDADFDGDRKADVLWRHGVTGANQLWRSASSAASQTLTRVANEAWKVGVVGDFNGDARADIVWRNASTGANDLWRSGLGTQRLSLAALPDTHWVIAGAGDFDGDVYADLFWRNTSTGENAIWLSGNANTRLRTATIADQNWQVAAIDDFDGDHKDDVLWRNAATGANDLWRAGRRAGRVQLISVTSLAWRIAGHGDFDGDGKADVFWRNSSTGANVLWLSADARRQRAMASVVDQNWQAVGTADYDGDGRSDVLWRHRVTGANDVWGAASASNRRGLTPMVDAAWRVVPTRE